MKKQYTIYLEPMEKVEKSIIDILDAKTGNPRQKYLREILSIGYLANLAGFGVFAGRLVKLQDNNEGFVLIPSTENKNTNEGQSIVSDIKTSSNDSGVTVSISVESEIGKVSKVSDTPTLETGSGLFSNLRKLTETPE